MPKKGQISTPKLGIKSLSQLANKNRRKFAFSMAIKKHHSQGKAKIRNKLI
jgi:hypothetical protein